MDLLCIKLIFLCTLAMTVTLHSALSPFLLYERDVLCSAQETILFTSRIIESLQYRRRPFGPLCLHRPQSHPALFLQPHTFYPANPPDANGQFSTANQPNPHTFGVWEETGAPGGNPCRHRENVQTPHSHQWLELNSVPRHCETAMLTKMLPGFLYYF